MMFATSLSQLSCSVFPDVLSLSRCLQSFPAVVLVFPSVIGLNQKIECSCHEGQTPKQSFIKTFLVWCFFDVPGSI